jgi:hypothetical protein
MPSSSSVCPSFCERWPNTAVRPRTAARLRSPRSLPARPSRPRPASLPLRFTSAAKSEAAPVRLTCRLALRPFAAAAARRRSASKSARRSASCWQRSRRRPSCRPTTCSVRSVASDELACPRLTLALVKLILGSRLCGDGHPVRLRRALEYLLAARCSCVLASSHRPSSSTLTRPPAGSLLARQQLL